MNRRWNKGTAGSHNDDSFNLLLILILKRALPVWQRYKGAVPQQVVDQLDLEGDWPSGVAAAAMKRLGRDPKLRRQVSMFKWRMEHE
jgi:hypothetical protein